MDLVAEAERQQFLFITTPPLSGQAADCGEGETAAGQSCPDLLRASCLPRVRDRADARPLPQISADLLVQESPRPQAQTGCANRCPQSPGALRARWGGSSTCCALTLPRERKRWRGRTGWDWPQYVPRGTPTHSPSGRPGYVAALCPLPGH